MESRKKDRKGKEEKMTTYLVKRKFKGLVTVDYALKKIICTHMRRSDG